VIPDRLQKTLHAILVAAWLPFCPMHAQSTMVEIDATRVLRTFDQNPVGININHLMDTDAKRPAGSRPLAATLRDMGVASLRFPEGELGDSYLWAAPPFPVTSAPRPQWALRGPDLWPANDPRFSTPDHQPRPEIMGFDAFLDLAGATEAEPIIIVAYDSAYKKIREGHIRPSLPELIASAAAWVRYANTTKARNIRYWEIGNETDIRPEAHSGADPGASQYAEDVVAFARAMKAEDPSIKIGINVWKNQRLTELLAFPALWPHVDFVSLRNYPTFGWSQGYDTFRAGQPNLVHPLQEAEAILQKSTLATDDKKIGDFVKLPEDLPYGAPLEAA
jgi:alpha-L-arabinofuranosidase